VPLSFSQFSSYLRCPRQYEYGYIKKLSKKISAGESFGSSIHNALKKWGEHEMVTSNKQRVTSNQLQLFIEDTPSSPQLTEDTLLELWHSSFIVEGYETRVEADMARLKGEQIMRFFYDWWQQQEHSVVLVEKGFSLDIQGQTIKGRFDRIEEGENGLKIIDFKTSAVRSQHTVDADLQLSVYALACEACLEQPCAELAFLFLTEEGMTEVATQRTPGQLTDAKKQIVHLQGRIAEGDFHPTPGRDVCRGCPYRGVCDVAAV